MASLEIDPRGLLLALCVAQGLVACAPRPDPGVSPSAPVQPEAPAAMDPDDGGLRLVVLIVVDQLPSWSFEASESLVESGIRRLLDEGTYYTRAEFPYAVTFTAPGHAAIGSGAPPAVTGIMANRWFDAELGRIRDAVEDPDRPVFAMDPEDPERKLESGISSSALLVDGVADAHRERTGGRGRSVAVGIKDRAAVLMLGRQPDLAVWYDDEAVAMTTSTAYADVPPRWLFDLGREHPVRDRLTAVWTPLDPALLQTLSGGLDASDGEGSAWGLGNAFPHGLDPEQGAAKAIRLTPFGNEMVIETALAAIEGEQLGADDIPDLLGLTFSSHDYAGHVWGQESWERLDMFLRLDRDLGTFFEALDRRIGEDRWAVVFTSDHGVTPMVERSAARGNLARRVTYEELSRAADRAIDRVLGAGDWVASIEASTVYLSPALLSQPETKRDRALDAVVAALRTVRGIAYAGRTDALLGDCDRREGLEALACRALHAERSGQIYFAAAPYCLVTDHYGMTGTSHGSPNPEDRVVPIIVLGPGREHARIDESVSMLRVAPTVARLLGTPPPPSATEPPL